MENSVKIESSLPRRFREILSQTPGAYLVGGWVRDALIGKIPVDCDLAVASDPAGFAARLAEAAGSRVILMGKPGMQVHRVPFRDLSFDVSPLYGGHIAADLRRRDFTINAMAYEPASGRIIDPADGRRDLGRRIRMVSEAAFQQDPLRMLRAFRLAAVLGLAIEEKTLAAIRAHGDRIQGIAGERVREELVKFFHSDDSAPYLEQMAGSGLLETLLPELTPLKQCPPNRRHRFDPFTHTLAAYGHLEALLRSPEATFPATVAAIVPKEAALLKWAMVLHDIGKPPTCREDDAGEIHYHGHDRVGADLAAAVCGRLRFSREEGRFVEAVVRHHLGPLHLFLLHAQGRLGRRAVSRFFMRCGDQTAHVLVHGLADYLGKGRSDADETRRFTSFIRWMGGPLYADFKATSALPPLITGRDLIQELNLPPSPVFKRVLQGVETARLAGAVRTREEALQAAADLLSKMDDT